MQMKLDLLVKLGNWAHTQAQRVPWTNAYGLARTLLAGATAATLFYNPTAWLFYPGVACEGPAKLGLVCLLHHRESLSRIIMIAGLLVVASGWRPRFTGVLHWWIAYSFWSATRLSEGGDLVALNLVLLLIPVTLTDPRKWHWSTMPVRPRSELQDWASLLAKSALIIIRCQVAYIYFESSVAKLSVPTWIDGTAVYYWINQPLIGAPYLVRRIMQPLLLNSAGVTLLTWGVIAIEFFLFLGLVLPKKYWPTLLVLGVALHAAIVVFFGLTTFSIIMCAALLLYLYPADEVLPLAFTVPRFSLIPAKRRRWQMVGAKSAAVPDSVSMQSQDRSL